MIELGEPLQWLLQSGIGMVWDKAIENRANPKSGLQIGQERNKIKFENGKRFFYTR